MKQEQPDMKKRILESSIFGSSLKQLTKKDDGLVVPYVLFRLCNFIGMNGITEKGLFNSSTNPEHLEYLKTCFNQSGDVPLETESSILSAADLLKLFLLELADPVIPSSMNVAFSTAMNGFSRKQCAKNLKHILLSVPEENYIVLKYISEFLYKVTCHNLQNDMTATALGSIFGPLIFRVKDTDSQQDTMKNEVVTLFISDYKAIFEKEVTQISVAMQPRPNSPALYTVSPLMPECLSRHKILVPTIMKSPLSLEPLSVVIPPLEKSLTMESLEAGSDLQIPTLIINSKKKMYNIMNELETASKRENGIPVTKGTEFFEETTCSKTFCDASICKKDRKSFVSSEEQRMNISGYEEAKFLKKATEDDSDEKLEKLNLEEESDSLKENMAENGVPTKSSHKSSMKGNIKPCRTQEHNQLHDRNGYSTQTSNNHTEKAFETENRRPSETEEVFAPLDLSYLQEYELDDEPVLSEHRFSWPLFKPTQDDDDVMLSPSINFLRNSSSSEAPLSPSAYKVYLSHRSLHLDPSIPPSPPKEQDDFSNRVTKSSGQNIKVKQLKKKIHSYKKKLKQFDESFEDEHGYRPSYVEKMNYPNMKKLIINMTKAKKDLRDGENSLTESGEVTPRSHWLLTREIHVLEDTTNSTAIVSDTSGEENEYKNKPSVEESFKEAVKNLIDERKQYHRPEDIEAMTKEEIMEEKLAIQKALLQLEDIHGRPMDKLNRDIMRPLYDRYHSIKCFIRGNGNSGSNSSLKDVGTELQPIIENVAMEFTSRQSNVKESNNVVSEQLSEENEERLSSGIRLHKKYNSSNLHELPLSELMNELQQTRTEKRKLRRILKEFEDEFYKKTGRKVQSEDKLPMETIYAEYKHMKGRLRLLEALVYKQRQHKRPDSREVTNSINNSASIYHQ